MRQPKEVRSTSPVDSTQPGDPCSLYADETDEALAFNECQQQLLDQAEQLLKRLRLLASISNEAETPDHALLDTEFHDLVGHLDEVLASEQDGKPLFDHAPRTVTLDKGRKRLVLQGIAGLRGRLDQFRGASLRTPAAAGEAREIVQGGFTALVTDQALSIENGTRLEFLARHLKEVEESF